MIDVGERLKELMEARGLNMHSLAKRSGLSWNTIKNFYSRKSIPTVTTISMLCDGLGIENNRIFRQLPTAENTTSGGDENDLCDV